MQDLVELGERLWYNAPLREAVVVSAYMLVGGALGIYVRALYRRFAGTVSNREGFSAVFPLLILATILVIFVVKSSLALSLGLVGALSIVRFRAAIKEPEEIVYLFFCIAAGLSLGAEYLTLAISGTVIFSLFVIGAHYAKRKGREHSLLLTIAGDFSPQLGSDPSSLTALVEEIVGPFTVQRLDVEAGNLQLRAIVAPERQEDIGPMVAGLRSRLPSCRVSYVNLEHLL